MSAKKPGLGARIIASLEEAVRGDLGRVTIEGQTWIRFGNPGMQGHDAPCYYCGKPCNSLAGNPGLWPVPLSHRDDPGRVKWHHIGCVSERLIENGSHERAKELEQQIVALTNFIIQRGLYQDWMESKS